MKTKLLILSALAALVCVSCGKTESPNGKDAESSSAKEISESANIPQNADEVNAVDEEATKKGNTPAYEVRVKRTDKNGKINEHKKIKNCFDDLLFTDEYAESEYEYKYNSDGLVLEEKSSMAFGDYSVETLSTYQYDEYGNIALMHTVQLSDDSLGGGEYGCSYTNEYDDEGRQIRITAFDTDNEDDREDESAPDVTEFKYDKNGKVVETFIDSPVMGKRKTVFEYDSRGNRISELETIIKDGEEKRGLEIYTVYNSRDLPEAQDWFKNDELVWHYDFEYEFYNE